jgi:GNAT superfamily N-acetyltransferase
VGTRNTARGFSNKIIFSGFLELGSFKVRKHHSIHSINQNQNLTTANELAQSLIIREVVKDDIPKLTQLHVTTWNATHPKEPQKPTYERREQQWQQAFADGNNNWFCFVIETENKELIGFAKGLLEEDGSGALNKLYLLEEYKKQGLGRKLLCSVARKFYVVGVKVMWVVTNPSPTSACAFYERFGGILKQNTEPGIAVYVWRDLEKLIACCNEVKV